MLEERFNDAGMSGSLGIFKKIKINNYEKRDYENIPIIIIITYGV